MPSRKSYALLVAIAISIFLLDAWRHGAQVVDDAYIALRYSRNLVEGHGAVYNAGERVEGYTSLGFMWLGALFLRLGIPAIAGWKAVSLVAAGAAVVGAARLERFARRAAVLATPTDRRSIRCCRRFSSSRSRPSPTGRSARSSRWCSADCSSGAWCSVCARSRSARGADRRSRSRWPTSSGPRARRSSRSRRFALALREWQLRRPDLRFLRRHAGNIAIVTATVAAHLAWRYSYYGDWRPNTYYAKVTGGSEQILTGLQYAGKLALALPVLVLALAVPLLELRARRRARGAAAESTEVAPRRGSRSPAAVIAIVALALILLTIGLGGDSQPFHRFFIPALPLLAALAALAARHARGRALTATAAVLFAVHVVAAHVTTQPYVAFVADRTTRVGSAVGDFFAERLAPDELLATNTAGSLPYESNRPALDTLGLADAAIARRPIYITSTGWAGHRRGWGEYVLRRHPRAILFYNTAGAREPFYLGDRELLELPGFRFFYRLRTTNLPALESSISWPAARYLGFPFGRHPSGVIVSPDLGLEARFTTGTFGYTTFAEGPITVTWFERDRRDDALWAELGPPQRDGVAAFVDAVAARWRATPPPGAPDARGAREGRRALRSGARGRRAGRPRSGALAPLRRGGTERRGALAARLPLHRKPGGDHRRSARRAGGAERAAAACAGRPAGEAQPRGAAHGAFGGVPRSRRQSAAR